MGPRLLRRIGRQSGIHNMSHLISQVLGNYSSPRATGQSARSLQHARDLHDHSSQTPVAAGDLNCADAAISQSPCRHVVINLPSVSALAIFCQSKSCLMGIEQALSRYSTVAVLHHYDVK